MSEIRNCEEYVLARIKDLEEENAKLRRTNELLQQSNFDLQSGLNMIKSYVSPRYSSDGTRYIEISSQWERYSGDRFNDFKELFNLKDSDWGEINEK